MGTSPRSLNATSSKSLPRSRDARKKLRPMRPKPLMPTRVFAMADFYRKLARSSERSDLGVHPLGRNACLGGHRDLDTERAAFRAIRLDPDAAVEAADELAADVEAESRASDSAGHVRIDAVELLEDAASLGRGDAEPAVADAEQHMLRALGERDSHRAAVRRVLDGVLDEIHEHLPQLLPVGPDRGQGLRRRQLEGHALRQMHPGGGDDAL